MGPTERRATYGQMRERRLAARDGVLLLRTEWILPYDSSAWTGRPSDAGPPSLGLRRRWNNWLWPDYRCENCNGMSPQYGCECHAKGAIAPGIGPEPWRVWLRKLPRRWRRFKR